MAALKLSIALSPNPRNWPIIDGSVKVEGADLVCNVLHPSEMFWRQLNLDEFDISEMSCSSLMMAGARRHAMGGLPVFTTRRFFHTGIMGRRDAGIHSPADRKGSASACRNISRPRRCGRAACCSTSSACAPEIEWWMERDARHSHGGATGFKPPPGVTATIPQDKSIASMMVSGKLHAALHYIAATT